jgi:predicted transposase/invertase (TIGR01784 family)
MSDEERKRYEKYLVNFIRDNDVLNTARVEGRAEGERIGISKGKAEGKIEIAKRMKAKGLPIDEIVDFTGLSETEIEKL